MPQVPRHQEFVPAESTKVNLRDFGVPLMEHLNLET